ncbi:fatty acid desaturase-domain-containing protein [Lipomyces kononenkoae]|uniref:Fatty acid desaturase-domain-containing protein n=1 Tax=Lipomyces kononenkoae TaxID=34357 RepID=A0ACC3ST25_LIPKO
MGLQQTLSRDDVEAMIGDGKAIVIYENRVLRLDSWLHKHPGGDKVVFHMVGRDATDEFNAYHSDKAKAMSHKFQIGRIDGVWKNFVPPIQGGFFRTKEMIDDVLTISTSSSSRSSSISSCSSSDEVHIHNGSVAQKRHNSFNSMTDSEEVQKVTIASPSVREPPTSAELIAEYDRKLVEHDLKKYPSLDYRTQTFITNKYRELEAMLQREGYFKCTYWGYGSECVRYIILAALSYYFLQTKWYLLSATCLGLLWHQLMFTAHDAAHRAITGSFFWDNIIGGLIANYISGLSIGWWKSSHNVHHFVTNDPVHDPDIQQLPFFAVSTKTLNNIFSTYYNRLIEFDAAAQVMVSIQNWTYYPVLCLGRFNLHRLSWEHLLIGKSPRHGEAAWLRYYEIVGVIAFWYWYGYLLVCLQLPTFSIRVCYVLVSHIATMPLHVQVTLSHFAMSTADLGVSESFAQKMLRTTMDVDCPAWLDFLHGGLQFQAVHHLFPRMPRHNFRAAQKHVIDFCKIIGMEYRIYGFVDGNKAVLSKLEDIAKQASILAECTNHMKKEATSGLT